MLPNEDRSRRLHTAKLTATIERYWPGSRAVVRGEAFGAFGLGEDQATAFVLCESATGSAGTSLATVGGVLALCARHAPHVERVVVLVPPEGVGYVPEVWARLCAYAAADVEVRVLTPNACTTVAPEPFPDTEVPSVEAWGLASELELAELEVVAEAGIIRGEVLGLEVARVVSLPSHPTDPSDANGHLGLDIGIGRFDQEISRMLGETADRSEALRRCATLVRQFRVPAPIPHPLATLCRERWMRVATPERADRTTFVEPVQPRSTLREASVCGLDDGTYLSVFSSGVSLDAVPQAIDMGQRCQREDGVERTVRLVVPDETMARVHTVVTERMAGGFIDAVAVEAPPWVS